MELKDYQHTDKANPDTKLSSDQGNFMQANKLSPPQGVDTKTPPIDSGTK